MSACHVWLWLSPEESHGVGSALLSAQPALSPPISVPTHALTYKKNVAGQGVQSVQRGIYWGAGTEGPSESNHRARIDVTICHWRSLLALCIKFPSLTARHRGASPDHIGKVQACFILYSILTSSSIVSAH